MSGDADARAAVRAAQEGAAVRSDRVATVLRMTGRDRKDLLHRLTTNDVRGLDPGEGHGNCITTNKGRIVDWVTLHVGEDDLLLFGSPGHGDAVRAWIDRYTILEDVRVVDVTADVALLHVLGPAAREVVSKAFGSAVHELPPFASCAGTGPADLRVLVLRTLGTIEHAGFFVIGGAGEKHAIEEALRAAAGGALPVLDDEAYEAARIAAGLPRMDAELGEGVHPLEAGLWGSVSFTKGCYVGQEVIARLNTYDKVMRNLVRLELSEDPRVTQGTLPVKLFAGGQEVGTLTSVAGPPLLERVQGLGYVKKRLLQQVGQGEAELAVGAPESVIRAKASTVVKI